MGRREAFEPTRSRTFAMVGHRSSGKTSLGEEMLAAAGALRTPGSVDKGTALLDHHDEERRRRQSLHAAYAWLEWEDHLLHLIDSPGSDVVDHERALAMAGADAAVVVLDAAAGVELGTRRALEDCAAAGLPALVVVNKVDRPFHLDRILAAVEAACGRRAVPIQCPFHDTEGRLAGVVSLHAQKVLRYDSGGGGAFSPEPLPERLEPIVRQATERLAEAVALTDDDLLETYLEYLELPPDQVRRGLARAVRTNRIVPVLFASAVLRIGAEPVLDAVCAFLPGPLDRTPPVAREFDGTPVDVAPDGPFCAQLLSTQRDTDGSAYHVLRVWGGTPPRSAWVNGANGLEGKVHKLYQLRGPRRRTIQDVGAGALVACWSPLPGRPGDTFTAGPRLVVPRPAIPPPMMAFLVTASSRSSNRGPTPDEASRFREALQELLQHDAALELHADETTGGLLLAGQNEAHLALAVHRIQDWFGVRVQAELPPVGYRETPRASVTGVHGVHVREGGDGLVAEYGKCTVDVVPQPPAEGNQFVDRTDDPEALPAKYLPAIGEGVERAMRHGPTAGYPVLGVGVHLRGGDYNILQSKDDHFRMAGENALRAALQRSGTRLLEPWWRVEVEAPQHNVGDILADMAAHRGRILGMEAMKPSEGGVRIRALCPYRELRTFGSRLRARTAGRGRFVSSPSHYEPVPRHLIPDAIAASPFRPNRDRATPPAAQPRGGKG